MSQASRQRALDRFHRVRRHGFETFAQFRDWQRAQLAVWRDPPQWAEAMQVWSHQLGFHLTPAEPMTYPEPPDDSPFFGLDSEAAMGHTGATI